MDGIAGQTGFVKPKISENAGLSVAPTHWWDLGSSDWLDSAGDWHFVQGGTVTITAGNGPGGQDTATFPAGYQHYLNVRKNPISDAGIVNEVGFSVAGWANHATLPIGGGAFFVWSNAINGHMAGFIHWGDPPRFAARVRYHVNITAPEDAVAGEWYHFGLAYDGTTRTYTFYVNGVPIGTNYNNSYLLNADCDFTIGRWFAYSAYSFAGSSCSMGFVNDVWQQSDFEYLYHHGLSGGNYSNLNIL